MIVRDIMEEKQLNLNQPLLSVRRFSSKVTSETDHKRKTGNSLARFPSYKSELKSGPVRNAGNVPFIWEKTPGRPKDESKLQTQAVEQPPMTPNPPPGRVSKTKQQDSDIVSKGASVTEMRTGSTVSNSKSVASLDKKVTKHESSKEEIQEKKSSDSDDGDEVYLDALDTLSRTESFLMSSTVSVLSGWDDQEVQPSGSFSSDQQARDFMIDRFLPAAKAMTSEPPQYASKKPLVGQEQQKQLKKVVSIERSRPLNQHRPKALPHYTQDIGREGSKNESDDCSGSENYTPTACGLFPRFCLLNTIPGSRMEDKVQSSAVHGMQGNSNASRIKTTKEHAKTPYYRKKKLDSLCGFTEEKEILDFHEKSKHSTDLHGRGCSKLLACASYESPIVEKTLYVDSVHKVKSQTNHRGDGFESLRRDSGINNIPSIDSLLESSNGMPMEMTNLSKKIDSEKQGLTKPGNRGCDLDQDLVVISSPKVVECKKIDLESQVSSSQKNSEADLKSQQAAKLIHQESTLCSSKVGGDEKIDLESQCIMKLDHQETSDTSYFELPLALPSLKAPSESWLKRTLPTITSRNMPSRSNLAAYIYALSQPAKTASLYPKWETIVKPSHVHHGHLHFPEVELLAPIPEA
ncbi:uncharacterized protein LOC133302183 [Gastrolobium bilobum]|uniref:uncharacterized protein LOC133302183 n=1 Tax=Gastrolobium bilobum TaxID=150636 RepID=UPI002AB18E5F|nr:uncharacterized protein LOC133302183 [Gastrolobium bilobum]